MIELDLFDAVEPQAEDSSSGNHEGGITFVFHKNGKRIVLSKRVLNLLGNPVKVSIMFKNEYLIILNDSHGKYTLRDSKLNTIYNTTLIKETLDHFGIDYSENVCQTFSEIEQLAGKENTIAVKMLKEQIGGDSN